jgi:hypothetical protein
MRRFTVLAGLLFALLAGNRLALGKAPEWDKAKVIKADFTGSETEAVYALCGWNSRGGTLCFSGEGLGWQSFCVS